MSEPSETNKFFNELKGLAEDLQYLRDENERLKRDNQYLEHQLNYWRIEAKVDHDRWLRALHDNEELRKKMFL